MDQVVNHVSGTNPEQFDLAELQLFDQIVRFFALVLHPATAGQSVGPNVREITQRAVANFVDQCRSSRRMTALQPGGDLDSFLFRFLARTQHPLQTSGVGRKRFLHEDVDALFDRVLDMNGSNVGPRRAHGDVTRS